MEIRLYLEVLQRRAREILLVTVLTLAVVAVATAWMAPVYSASATVRLALGSSGPVSYTELTYADRLMNTYVHLLKSGPFLKQVIQRLKLNDQPDLLAESIKVEAIPNTELIRISAERTNPSEAMLIANTLATLLVEQRQQVYLGEGKPPLQMMQEQISSAEQKLAEDRALLATLTQTPADPNAAATIRDLTSRISREESDYASLLSRYHSTQVEEAAQASSISLADPATEPLTPSRPRTAIYLALGALMGFVGGVGLAFLFENLDGAIHAADDLKAVTTLPLIGRIPKLRKRKNPVGASGGLEQLQDSSAGEAFQSLSTNLLALQAILEPIDSRGKGPTSTLMITSAEPRAGKSVVTANLAVAIAQTGRRLVVVDANLRAPRLHHLFNLPNEVGLADVLLHNSPLATAIQDTTISGLKFLSSGSTTGVPPVSLNSAALRKLFRKLAQWGQLILLDTPSILTSADASTFASSVDGILVVATRDHTTARSVEQAQEQLSQVGGRILGIVYNKAKGGDLDFHYYSYRSNPHDIDRSVASTFEGS